MLRTHFNRHSGHTRLAYNKIVRNSAGATTTARVSERVPSMHARVRVGQYSSYPIIVHYILQAEYIGDWKCAMNRSELRTMNFSPELAVISEEPLLSNEYRNKPNKILSYSFYRKQLEYLFKYFETLAATKALKCNLH